MSGQAFRVGLVQMRSGLDPARNIADAVALIGEAARRVRSSSSRRK